MFVAFIAIGIDASSGGVYVDFVVFGDDEKLNKSSYNTMFSIIKASSRCIIV